MSKRKLTAKEPSRVGEWKITTSKHQVKGIFNSTDPTGFLLKTGQSNQISPGGWYRWRNLIRH